MIVTLRIFTEGGEDMAKKKGTAPKKKMGPIVTGGKPVKKKVVKKKGK